MSYGITTDADLRLQALLGEEVDLRHLRHVFRVVAQQRSTRGEYDEVLQLQVPALPGVLPHDIQRPAVLRVHLEHLPGQPQSGSRRATTRGRHP